MIEKLPFEITQGEYFEITQGEYERKKFDIKSHTSPFDMQVKINELVDAVNELQKHEEQHLDLLTQLNEMRLHQDKEPAENSQSSKMERPADPYAEQRKWVGKLCKFWDFVYDNYYFDTLKGITDKGLFIGHNGSWEHCEPVLPDDDIIFKGE